MNLLSRLIHFVTVKEVGSHVVVIAAKNKEKVHPTTESEEIYKKISEDNLQTGVQSGDSAGSSNLPTIQQIAVVTENNILPTMVQDENNVNDGADEQMLGVEERDKLAERREEVKFIKGDHQNGDAKIDIGPVNGKAFTGMTKEELMKYANDPFWVRLRWIFFIAFWAIWVGMLVGAILIIIDAPKCAAPEPLTWYKSGPLAKFGQVDAVNQEDVNSAKKVQASGVIYELPAGETYNVKTTVIEEKVKKLVDQYKDTGINVILDLTPNIAGKDSQFFKDALVNEEKRSAFVWIKDDGGNKPPTNWIKVGKNLTAWTKVDGSYVLSQFGEDTYDLRMNDTNVKQELSSVLKHLVGLGVKGFRLRNTKFYLISPDLVDETPSSIPKAIGLDINDYYFYNHLQTTFQGGLGDLLYEYRAVVKNSSSDAFLSVAEDVIRPEAYQTTVNSNSLGIDLPIYGDFVKVLSSHVPNDKKLQSDLEIAVTRCGNLSWVQWNLAEIYHDTPANPSALLLFMSLLPGVPVIPVDSIVYGGVTNLTFNHIKQLRASQSYMHGSLDVYDAPSVIAYSRIKSGNPGYFVIFNPTNTTQTGNYTSLSNLMTVDYLSDNFNATSHVKPKAKVDVKNLNVDPYSTIVLTYVPDKSN